MVRTISPDRVSQVEDDHTYVELGITFHPDDHENQPLKMDVNVIMAKGWTPKMYLATPQQIYEEAFDPILRIDHY